MKRSAELRVRMIILTPSDSFSQLDLIRCDVKTLNSAAPNLTVLSITRLNAGFNCFELIL